MNPNAKISLFAPFEHGKPNVPIGTLSIEEFCGNVIDGEYQQEIQAIRLESDSKRQKELKNHLPTVTISGEFSQAKNDCLIKHSGFIAIDIDGQDNQHISDWKSFRDTLGTWEEVLFCALSVRGAGVFTIIPIAYPDKHSQQYNAISMDFKQLGIKIDIKCRNVSRLRFISSDPQATWNPGAQPYRKTIIEQVYHQTYQPIREVRISRIAEWVNRKHGSFIKGNRNNWLTQLAGACHRLGIDQNQLYNYCQPLQQPDFNMNDISKTIRCIYSNQRWLNKR